MCLFFLRTGKRMPEKLSQIRIQFRPVPHQSFPASALEDWQPNSLLISIQPEMGIRIRFQAKRPGQEMALSPVDMVFNYTNSYTKEPPEAYETLLLDVMQGDATLFMRADQVEAAWAIIMPILEVWDDHHPRNFPNYKAGSWGPVESDALIAKEGFSWAVEHI